MDPPETFGKENAELFGEKTAKIFDASVEIFLVLFPLFLLQLRRVGLPIHHLSALW